MCRHITTPPRHLPAPLSVAEAECCTTVLKLTYSGPPVRRGGGVLTPPLLPNTTSEGKGHRLASISRPPSPSCLPPKKRERAEINGTRLVIETSETCSAVERARAALDVLLICMNPAIWGACINLTCSLELYSTVRNVDLGFLNYKTSQLLKRQT